MDEELIVYSGLDYYEEYLLLKLVIIAAGQGKRIRSITAESPKTLLKINGRTLLETLFENCLNVGISDVVVVTGYQRREI